MLKNLGYDIHEPDNMFLAGREFMKEHNNKVTNNIIDYLNRASHLLNDDVITFLRTNTSELQKLIDDDTHLTYNWFSANTFINNYLLTDKNVLETVQLCFLRIAVQLNLGSTQGVKQCYNELREKRFVFASPCFFNAGLKKPQMSSCFLYQMDDNTDSITKTWSRVALLSKYNGGNGIDLSRIRHSEVANSGITKGVVPIAQVINGIIRMFDQGGKRRGTATLYLRPHHIDVFQFCELTLKTGDIYARAHDINTALWCSWLFFWRVLRDEDWTLFCPNYAPELNDVYGLEFNRLYCLAERREMPSYAKKVVKARELYEHIVRCQLKSSMPYILHADACNYKSNHRFMGYIPCGNLCLEVIQHSSSDKVSSCNLASLSLKSYVVDNKFDYQQLSKSVRILVRNLDNMIERNWYPDSKISEDNKNERPLSIGVSGFADMLYQMNLSFEDEETLVVNKRVFACIYFNALVESVELAIQRGKFADFNKSPLAQGKLQFDLWRDEYELLCANDMKPSENIRRYEDDEPVDPHEWNQETIVLSNSTIIEPTWNSLKQAIMTYGVRNSLLIGLMPTCTSSQILMNAESTETHQGIIYSRKLNKGAYPVVNMYAYEDLKKLGLWNEHVVNIIQSNNGSLSSLRFTVKSKPELFPKFNGDFDELKRIVRKYKTMYELPQKRLIKLAADRARYICQSQSTNIYISDPTEDQLKALHIYTMQIGLKTGMYYLRTCPAIEPIKLTMCYSCS